ncbi:DUF4350 domain-containing protein [Subtercola sp. YIM 133946]|uniref:DUF4350 domain-containing protein n=1 Tax=Subtercola sp. YIM 133946 TaxID=3118909 RepID=UPI002F954205
MSVSAPGRSGGLPAGTGAEPEAGAAPSSTPTVRAFFRRWSFWVGAGVFVVVASLVLLLVKGGSSAADASPLSITSPAPVGSKALAEVLRQQGVTVTAVSSLDDAEAAVAAAGGSAGSANGAASTTGPTVLIYDPDQYLPGDRYAEVSTLGARIVLVQPDLFELEGVAPSIAVAGSPDGPGDDSATVDARCDLPAAVRAGSITVSGTTYRPTGGAGAGIGSSSSGIGVTACFPSAGETGTSTGTGATGTSTSPTTAYSLVATTAGPVPVTVLGAPDVLSNEQIVNAGNAALALGLLGQSSTLVWYTPTAADLAVTGPPSLAALTPGWVTPVILLLFVLFLAAAVWRGRRLGPLVVENLPVIVRGNETVVGRARLYARSGARTRALDALRIGSSGRLAGMLGLPRTATLDEIILACSAATGLPPAAVAEVLVNRLPTSETELLTLSQRLADLEAAVRHSVYGPHSPDQVRNPGD